MNVAFWDKNEQAYSGPDYSPMAWEQCTLAGVRVPGVVNVVVVPKQKIEALKVHGVDGGPTIERGHEATKVLIEVRIWTPSQWELFQQVLSFIWRQPGKGSRLDDALARDQKANGVKIVHPACALYNITAVAIESPGCPIINPEKMEMTQRVQALQFIPQSSRNATKKIKGARVPLTPEFQLAKNAAGPDPADTDGVPQLMSPAAPFSALTR